MNCPKCNAAMEPVYFEGITVDRCSGCQGLWFDADERAQLRVLKGSAAIDTGSVHLGRKMDKITNILCPRCQTPMTSSADVEEHDINFEYCDSCRGVFLDAGEFKDLKQFSIGDYFKGLFTPKKKKA